MPIRLSEKPLRNPAKEGNMYFDGLYKPIIQMPKFLMFKELGCLASRLGAYSYTSALHTLEAFAKERNYTANDVYCYAFNRMWNYPDYWEFEDAVRKIGNIPVSSGITRWSVPAYLMYKDNHTDVTSLIKAVVDEPWVSAEELPPEYKELTGLLLTADLGIVDEDDSNDMAIEIASSYCEHVGYSNVSKFLEQCSKNYSELETALEAPTQLDGFMQDISLGFNKTLKVEYRKASPDARTRVKVLSMMFGMEPDLALVFDMFCFNCVSIDAYNKFVASMVANDYTKTSAEQLAKMVAYAKEEYPDENSINNYKGYLICNMFDALGEYEHERKVDLWEPPFTPTVRSEDSEPVDTSSYDAPLTSYGGPTLYDVCTKNKEVIEAAKKYFNDNEPELLTYKLARDNNLNTVNEILAFLRKG